MSECAHLRIGKEFLASVSWPSSFRRKDHDRCYCHRCYPANLADTLTVAGYTYVIPRGWTRFAVAVDESFFNHHNVWDTWLNCYHGTSIDSAKSCVEHRQLLLPDDVTMHGKKIGIREDHIPEERFVFTTPSISYAALDCYAYTHSFRSPYDLKLYSIKVVLQCKQKADSIIVQPETVCATKQGRRLCPHIPNEELEWKTKHRSSVMIYGLLLEIKQNHASDDSNSPQYQKLNISVPPASNVVAPEPSITEEITNTIPKSESLPLPSSYRKPMSKTRIALLVVLIISTFLPMAALTIGQIYKSECPIQPWIPRWVTVFGSVGLSASCLMFVILFINFKWHPEKEIGKYVSGCILCLLLFFFLAWLIAGSVWIFSVKPKIQFVQTNATNYCQETLYKFAFGLTLAQYSLIGVLMCCGGIVALIGCLC
ncbi:unnamed protein product [Adineta ricciae]|uniref:Uncharacterized protein n=1 Tax=Adineta ricciae TaxID=249248 RepID=A0A814HWB3_ADIRI|nr:unnamed protein product [Adineta ricciae]